MFDRPRLLRTSLPKVLEKPHFCRDASSVGYLGVARRDRIGDARVSHGPRIVFMTDRHITDGEARSQLQDTGVANQFAHGCLPEEVHGQVRRHGHGHETQARQDGEVHRRIRHGH